MIPPYCDERKKMHDKDIKYASKRIPIELGAYLALREELKSSFPLKKGRDLDHIAHSISNHAGSLVGLAVGLRHKCPNSYKVLEEEYPKLKRILKEIDNVFEFKVKFY